MVICTEYWNKVSRDKGFPIGIKPLPEYEIKSQWKIDTTLSELKNRVKNHPRMTILKDKIIEEKGKDYGIHIYVEYKEG